MTRPNLLSCFKYTGATVHEPLSAIENLTPVKVVPDDVKQLPINLPKIKTFNASARYVTTFHQLSVISRATRSRVGRAHDRHDCMHPEAAAPAGLLGPRDLPNVLQQPEAAPAKTLHHQQMQFTPHAGGSTPLCLLLTVHLPVLTVQTPFESAQPHTGSAAPPQALLAAPCPQPRACQATTRHSSTPPATQDGWSPSAAAKPGPRPLAGGRPGSAGPAPLSQGIFLALPLLCSTKSPSMRPLLLVLGKLPASMHPMPLLAPSSPL
jgi:hypothetical protein